MSFATPFFRSFATRTFATPKNLFLILEGVVDKELAKEADVEVNQEGDKDVANVVNEFSHVKTVSRSIW